MAASDAVTEMKGSTTHIEKSAINNPKEAAADAAAQGQAVIGYESLTLWQTVKTFKVATAICFAVASSAAADGYQISINGSIIANAGFVQQFATAVNAAGAPYLESPILSGFGSIQSVGQIIGMLALPFVSTRFGRKWAFYTLWAILTASVLAESLASAWQHWLLGKLLAGIGVGCIQTSIPTYILEVAPTRIRGAMLMCYSFWWSLGGFFGNITLQQMNVNDPTNYKTPILTQWGMIGLMAIIFFFVPETPAWCVSVGQEEYARKALLKVNYAVVDFDVERSLSALLLMCEHEKQIAQEQKREHWYAIFLGVNGIRTLISSWGLVTQQFIGLTLFASYGTYFFQQAGLKDPFAITCINTSLSICVSVIVMFTADHFGRRSIACTSATLAWTCCVAIGILGVTRKVRASDILFVLFASLWTCGMSINASAGWAAVGEISSQRLRPYTAGFGAALSCVVGVVMSQLVPYMVNVNGWNWGLKTAWFYAGVGLPFTVGVWLLIPETTGRSAAELDELFNNKVKPWRFAKTETATQRLIKAAQI